MASPIRNIQVIIGTAALTCASVLALSWPRETQADDAESAVAKEEDIGADTTKIGALQVTTRLVKDEKVRGKWFIEVKVHNTNTEERQTAEVQEAVMRTDFRSMMARSGPIPTVAWKTTEKIDVLPNETAIVRHPIPAPLAQQIANATKPQKLARNGEPVMQSSTMFSTSVSATKSGPPGSVARRVIL